MARVDRGPSHGSWMSLWGVLATGTILRSEARQLIAVRPRKWEEYVE
jgi:hypothetical protein